MEGARSITPDVIARIVAVLKSEGAREVYLFGSSAKGTSGRASDIDVAVSGLPPARFFFAAGAATAHAGGWLVDMIDLDTPTPMSDYLRASGELRRVG